MKVSPATSTFHSTCCATEPFGRISERAFAHCPCLFVINANDTAKMRSNADVVVVFVVDLVEVRQFASLVFLSQHDPRVNGHREVRECRQVGCFRRCACQSVGARHICSLCPACTFISTTRNICIVSTNTGTTEPILCHLPHPLSSYILLACLACSRALQLLFAKFGQNTVSSSRGRK